MTGNYKRLFLFGLTLFFLTAGAFFMVNVELPSWSYLLSALNVLLFALPAFWATVKWLGWRSGLLMFLALGIFALLVETNAIITGFPYGHFGYSELLGYKLFGYVPWTVAFAWTPLILAAFAIAHNLVSSRLPRILLIVLLLVLFDLVLDPGAVLLGFWKYPAAGIYYGVPLSNFIGWIFSGFIGAVLLEFLMMYFKPLLPVPAQLIGSAYFIVFFWTAIAIFGGMPVPALIGLTIITGFSIFYQKFNRQPIK